MRISGSRYLQYCQPRIKPSVDAIRSADLKEIKLNSVEDIKEQQRALESFALAKGVSAYSSDKKIEACNHTGQELLSFAYKANDYEDCLRLIEEDHVDPTSLFREILHDNMPNTAQKARFLSALVLSEEVDLCSDMQVDFKQSLLLHAVAARKEHVIVPLLTAIIKNKDKYASILWTPNPDNTNRSRTTPITMAIKNRDAKLAERLVKTALFCDEKGCRENIDTTDLYASNTALMLAASQRMDSLVEILLEAGADPKKRNDCGKNALDLYEMAGGKGGNMESFEKEGAINTNFIDGHYGVFHGHFKGNRPKKITPSIVALLT